MLICKVEQYMDLMLLRNKRESSRVLQQVQQPNAK